MTDVDKEKIYKEVIREKQKRFATQFALAFGHMPLVFYILCSAMYISISWTLYIYSSLFQEVDFSHPIVMAPFFAIAVGTFFICCLLGYGGLMCLLYWKKLSNKNKVKSFWEKLLD